MSRATQSGSRPARSILITGGAGFIGSNLAERLLSQPDTRVRVFDDLSRCGVAHNLAWLRSLADSERLEWVPGDIRNPSDVARAAEDVDEIYHLAAQVAVTTSVEAPRDDLEINVIGTFNVLEAARRSANNPFLLFTSTNKVYGALRGVPTVLEGTHYRAQDQNFGGVGELEPLDFHSPYGCSKGAADQYVHDYARIYNLPTVVFRMSCIAGPRQFGTEDQGWIAHFLYSVLERRPITIYGDGYQVRDILHVYDLVDAMEAAHVARDTTAGEIYNVGGGLERSISVADALQHIQALTGIAPHLRSSEVRPGDQPLYISDTSRLTAHTGWLPRRSRTDIFQAVYRFWQRNRELLTLHRTSAAAGGALIEADLVSQEMA